MLRYNQRKIGDFNGKSSTGAITDQNIRQPKCNGKPYGILIQAVFSQTLIKKYTEGG
jgi:hypothetical protein